MVVLVSVFCVAALYASVGHGGASGYLAVMSLAGVGLAQATGSALILNVLVAGSSWIAFARAGHFSARLVWPFLLASVPAAAIGGRLELPLDVVRILLAAALGLAAFRMMLPDPKPRQADRPAVWLCLVLGGSIGLLSGIVGIGGGVFLSPVLILTGWADPKRAAAASSNFIVVNSIAGLAGRFLRNAVEFQGMGPLLSAAFVGGVLGGWLGASRFKTLWLRRLLSIVLLIAAAELLRRGLAG